MKACLAEVMGVDEDQISIKATTTEKLGFHGQNGGNLRLCHRSYPERIERNSRPEREAYPVPWIIASARPCEKLYTLQNVDKCQKVVNVRCVRALLLDVYQKNAKT